MRTRADDTTADQLLDYLAGDGYGADWTLYADLAEWESLYSLHGERGFVGRLARSLAGRGLADVRRASSGMQLQLTPTGEDFAGERRDRLDHALAGLSLCGLGADAASGCPKPSTAIDSADDNGAGRQSTGK